MKIQELRQKSPEILKNLMGENQLKIASLKPQLFQKKIKNVKEMKMLKKDIARIKTILNEIQINNIKT